MTNNERMTRDQIIMVDHKFKQFLHAVQVIAVGHSIGIKETKAYWRIVKTDEPSDFPGEQKVYCFVRKIDGAIFRPCNYHLRKKRGQHRLPGQPEGYLDNYDPTLLGTVGLTYGASRPAMRPKFNQQEYERQQYERQRQEALEIVEGMGQQHQ